MKKEVEIQKNIKGITIVALVVTIIVLIILAGISINLTLGENGIITKARLAKESYLNAQEAEEQELASLYNEQAVPSEQRQEGELESNLQILEKLKELEQKVEKMDELEEQTGTLKQQIEQLQNEKSKNPTGTVISYMGNKAPDGYLFCDGTIYNITQYPELAEQIKNEFGRSNYYGGDGTTTFAVPNLQGEFLRGYTKDANNSKTTGIATVNVGMHQNPTLIKTGVIATGSSSNEIRLFQYGRSAASMVNNADTEIRSSGDAARTAYTTSGKASEKDVGIEFYTVRPTNTSVLYCIKF